jgi:hypothetical protein
MRSVVLACVCALAFCGVARADEPKKYYLIDGQITEKRISDLEARVAELEKQLKAAPTSAVKALCICGASCGCASGTCPACPTVAPASARTIHVSPDGTVNELHPDGVYRPVPGAPKQTPPAIVSVWSGSTCPGGSCPTSR